MKLFISKKMYKLFKRSGCNMDDYIVTSYVGNVFLFKIKYYFNSVIDWLGKFKIFKEGKK